MSQIPVLTQRIWGAFNPATNQIVGVQTSGEGVYQNVPNQLLGLTFAAVRTATSAATQSVEVMGHNTVSDGQGGTFAYNPADQTSGCVCIGSSAGTVLTVNTVTSGTVVVGQTLCSSVTGLPLATITSFGTGSGGSGTYNLSTTVNQGGPFTFLIDNNLTILVSADGSRWYLTSTNATISGLTAPSGNSAINITTPVYTFGNATDNPTYNFAGTGAVTAASINSTGAIKQNGLAFGLTELGTSPGSVANILVGQEAMVYRNVTSAGINSSTTLAVDTVLQLQNLPVGTYIVTAFVNFMSAATAAGASWALNYSAGTPGATYTGWYSQGSAAPAGTVYGATTFGTATTLASFFASNSPVNVRMESIVFSVSGAGGTLSVEWAQGTSNATNTFMNAGSWLRILRVV